ncbi:MAG: sigma-70 family RNA polymerase sigma factor [Candidatus Methylomirabilales bacterium]
MGPDQEDRKRREFEDTALVHMSKIYNVALRLTRNKTDAEDLFQETFLRAYRFFHQFRSGTDCRAWLFAILHSLFVNRVRRASYPTVDLDEERVYREGGTSSSLPGNPEVDLIHRLAGEDIERAIDALPPKLRVAVVLADIEGCSYREIAKICECPIGTVMSRLYRGRQALRDALKQYAGGDKAPQEDE